MEEYLIKERQERSLELMAQVVQLTDYNPFRQSELKKTLKEMEFDYYNDYHTKYNFKTIISWRK